MRQENDAVDIREFALALRRGWRWVVGGALAGLALAVLVLLAVQPRYQATASVLLRTQAASPGALISSGDSEGSSVSLGGLAEMFSLDSGFETELEILGSRAVVGAVVDSLLLQARVLEPWGTPLAEVLASAAFPADMNRAELAFRRVGDVYRVEGEAVRATATPGQPFEVRGVVMTLQERDLPADFTLEVVSHQDAVQRTLKALGVERAGGSVAELTYRDLDPYTSAAVPNSIIRKYMVRRTTTDRSTNRRRYDFLRDHTDSIAGQLVVASDALRRHQEQSGLLSPEVRTEAEVERSMALVGRRQELEIDARALAQVLSIGASGNLDARAVASYPTLIQNAAVNQLLARLSDLEARRTELLDRRTPEDPDVQLVELEIAQTQQRILEIARSFQAGVTRQLNEVERELVQSRQQLSSLPVAVERSLGLEREVERLSETLVALQTQLVQARLAAIAEGGDLMQVDVAEPPRQPLYPRAPLTLALGLLGGLFFGIVGAIGSASIGHRLHDVLQVERLTGLPAVAMRGEGPLLLRDLDTARSILVLAAGPGTKALPAARRIAATGALRGRTVVLADLQDVHIQPSSEAPASQGAGTEESGGTHALDTPAEAHGGGYLVFRANGNLQMGVRPLLEKLEQRGSLVVAALPPVDHPVTAALVESGRGVAIVVQAGETLRVELENTVRALDRLGVDVTGVVVDRGQETQS